MEGICEGHGCAEEVEEINIESWELTGKILCADCVDDDFARRAEEDEAGRDAIDPTTGQPA